ncbi:hypothetical protein RclHR1_02580004 [Rhizophagus clarus]|uniref:Uncharacterized protein n=1 Tax=Rhizophagus clarus TaxID=94130 RepID=A0A2Z6RFA2_9GLOM|nr:hypothetical protein RclHR1_02580004 [Rhizophagus clarus]GES98118.1 hypothetical protein GLOIN_2v1764957 [Rhizophagus clarus]
MNTLYVTQACDTYTNCDNAISDQQPNISSPNHNQQYLQPNVASPNYNQQYQQPNVASPNHQQQYDQHIQQPNYGDNDRQPTPNGDVTQQPNQQYQQSNDHHNNTNNTTYNNHPNVHHHNDQRSTSNNTSPPLFSPQSNIFPFSLNITINSPHTNFIIIPNSDIQQVLSFLNNPSLANNSRTQFQQ